MNGVYAGRSVTDGAPSHAATSRARSAGELDRRTAHRRTAGVTIPLFSLRSARSWGIGEIADLPELAEWLREAGIRLVQILPLGEIAAPETSPYSAVTAFGIDPIYISLEDVDEVRDDLAGALRGASGASGEDLLAQVRRSPKVDYPAVRALKGRALRAAFQRFSERELAAGTPRAQAFHAFCAENRAWLDDYALFRVLWDVHGGSYWWKWAAPLRAREPEALAWAREHHRRDIYFYSYVQWLAHTQWYEVRSRLASLGVELMGDLPFVVARDSVDMWANRGEFHEDFMLGAPPDVFDQEGQEWGLPPYRWARMRENDFAWLRRRARYMGRLFDRFRVDHVVGFYRTYMRPANALFDAGGRLTAGIFDPWTAEEQLAHGERVLTAMRESAREVGAELIAEDLGVIPDFVRQSLARLGVPGYKVLIWEKDGPVFRDPAAWEKSSVACFGTHDTAPALAWWEGLSREEREAVLRLPLLARDARELGAHFTPAVHEALMDLLNASASDLVLFLVQDVLGVRDRINTPATIGPHNWTYRLPSPVEEMRRDRRFQDALAMLRGSIERNGRG